MKKNQILASESFEANPKRYYFLDFMKADNKTHYIRFTRSELQEDGAYLRHSLIVFEDHFEPFIDAFSGLFHSAAYHGKGYQTVMDLAAESRAQRGIKSMPEELRPREKFYAHGAEALNDNELLAILLGSGSPGETAIALAQRILDSAGGSIKGLKDCSFSSLCRFKGMGLAKASAIMAGIEIAKRLFGNAISNLRVAK